MGAAPTVGDYRNQLVELLEQTDAGCTEEEREAVRARVHERRNRRRDRAETPVTPKVARHADAIIALLQDASVALRPRETQELDDLVAGKVAPDAPTVVPYAPVRLRRRGAG